MTARGTGEGPHHSPCVSHGSVVANEALAGPAANRLPSRTLPNIPEVCSGRKNVVKADKFVILAAALQQPLRNIHSPRVCPVVKKKAF